MNGIATNSLKEKIQVEKLMIKKNNYKFIISILLSNVLVYVLFATHPKQTTKQNANALHAGHQIIEIEARSNIAYEDKHSKITIVDELGHIIFPEGYLIMNDKNNSLTENPKFKIEIPQADVIKLSSIQNKKLLIIPFVIPPTHKKNEPRINYELTI